MITVIQSTNRADSKSESIAAQVATRLGSLYTGEVKLLNIRDIDRDLLVSDTYSAKDMPTRLRELQDRVMIPSMKFVWVLPEYNGSYPGVLKLFIDALSAGRYDEVFGFKKSLLIGITTGRSGNIRGMDHFADVLRHMKSIVYPRALPISRIGQLMGPQGITDPATLSDVDNHLEGFLSF